MKIIQNKINRLIVTFCLQCEGQIFERVRLFALNVRARKVRERAMLIRSDSINYCVYKVLTREVQ